MHVHGLAAHPLPGVANLGIRPSLTPNDVNGGRVLLETHCLSWPAALGGEGAAEDESFTTGLLEYPHYTRPPVFRDMAIPEILTSGNHAEIAKWRRAQSIARTQARRPDMPLPPPPPEKKKKKR